jgi:poly-gamma-glutamate capsule biosynthesis protein CapA/YwtB (metallophosphatase superfamily)
MPRSLPLLSVALWAGGCPGGPRAGELREAEESCSVDYLSEAVTVTGRLVDPLGAPLAGVVSVGDQVVTVPATGVFSVGIGRENALLTLESDGHYPRYPAVWGRGPRTTLDLGDVALTPRRPDRARMVFGGDVMFGRRYLQTEGEPDRNVLPPNDPAALISVDDPEPGSRAVIGGVRPWYQAADFGSVNLESVLTRDPETAHQATRIAYFSLPESAGSLTWLGVDYTALGNNHVYDYLDPGVTSTTFALEQIDLAYSGAGRDLDAAFAPHVTTLAGTEYAFYSATGLIGADPPLVADDDKPGAANINEIERFIELLRASADDGQHPVVQIHAGVEYSAGPTSDVIVQQSAVARAGASLVITHHPHVVQGFRVLDGVLIADSLGNLLFESERAETMSTYLLETDLDDGALAGASLVPLALRDFVVYPTTGPAAADLWRRIGASSYFGDVLVVPDVGGARLVFAGGVEPDVRTIEVPVTVDSSRSVVVDLRPWLNDDESIAAVRTTAAGARASFGQDLLLHGGFEDTVVDVDPGNGAWSTGSASGPCHCDPHRGAIAMCAFRDQRSVDPAVVVQRRRVRVPGDATDTPNKDVGVVVWSSATNGGPVDVTARVLSSEGDTQFSEEAILTFPDGDRPWQMAYAPVEMGPDGPDLSDPTAHPRSVQLLLRSLPPTRGESVVRFDDVAVVSWEPTPVAIDGTGGTLRGPQEARFLRVDAPPGDHVIEIDVAAWRLGR